MTKVIPLPAPKSRRKFDHERWNRDQSIRKFLWYLSRCDAEGFEASTNALFRLDCLGDALKGCLKGQRQNQRKLQILLYFWNERGLWSIPKALKEDLCLFTDVIRYFAPPYVGDGLTLYRGQSLARHQSGVYGISWTPRYEIAERFSALRDDLGIVVKVDASPDMIVAHVPDHIQTSKTDPANKLEFEDEYLLDPAMLAGLVTVAR
jgi:hypothetical protein